MAADTWITTSSLSRWRGPTQTQTRRTTKEPWLRPYTTSTAHVNRRGFDKTQKTIQECDVLAGGHKRYVLAVQILSRKQACMHMQHAGRVHTRAFLWLFVLFFCFCHRFLFLKTDYTVKTKSFNSTVGNCKPFWCYVSTRSSFFRWVKSFFE